MLLRTVIGVIARRALGQITSRHIQVGALHIDTAAKAADINATPCTSPAANSKSSSRWPRR